MCSYVAAANDRGAAPVLSHEVHVAVHRLRICRAGVTIDLFALQVSPEYVLDDRGPRAAHRRERRITCQLRRIARAARREDDKLR